MKKQSRTFPAVFTPEPEGGFTVTVPALPECVTYGETFEEAAKNAHEAVLLCLEHRVSRGEETVPEIHTAPIISSISVTAEELHV